ncbi:hypothetical protein D9758_016187 [Tetrapyrgos nigripes]|uniref:HAT C-terminal dimerisation domain-containing protein n=1 Tax=Tetrapyrgos nigripes TaxID=182062 RepID=A0A8H5C4P2_9AGAR|nr:hypothetical protein D9758_016187 [Tetrapyrgos nigripes]
MKREVEKRLTMLVLQTKESEHIEEVKDEEALPKPATKQANKVPGSNSKRTDAIYLFYKQVPFSASGVEGNPGNQHFFCLHSNHKVFTVSKKMNACLHKTYLDASGLKHHLKSNSKHLYQFFEILQGSKKRGVVWTKDDIEVAAGCKAFDQEFTAALDAEIDEHQENIKDAFTKQREAALEPWNQERFEELLVKWLVASNQPFSEVEQVEFIELLQYVHHNGGKLRILTDDYQRDSGDILVALSIDTWTLSNQYAFLAIATHYINEDGQLGMEPEDNKAVELDGVEEDSFDELKQDGVAPSVAKVISEPQLFCALMHNFSYIAATFIVRHAVTYKEAIDSYASQQLDLQDCLLDETDWANITKVTAWLKTFCVATLQMSTTKTPMLSSTLKVLHSLEDDVKEIISSLGPWDVSDDVCDALIAAHGKLMLDPHIDREALEADYEKDATLTGHLTKSRQELHEYFNSNYVSNCTPLVSSSSVPGPSDVLHIDGSPQKKFKSKYHQKVDAVCDELTEFWKQPPEDSEKCDPITWWAGHKATYLNLYCLALDIFSIPGSAVAVEHVFSGRRDTISLRRASLSVDTIRLLMIAKHQLYLA